MHAELATRIARTLRAWLVFGVVAVLLIPFARTNTALLGWLPMWLIAMPASALWALHRFSLPHLPEREIARRRRRAPQARRRAARAGARLGRLRAA